MKKYIICAAWKECLESNIVKASKICLGSQQKVGDAMVEQIDSLKLAHTNWGKALIDYKRRRKERWLYGSSF